MSRMFQETAADIARIACEFHARGWLLATSGNISAVTSRDPLHLAITPSGVDKGQLTPALILEIDQESRPVAGHLGKPSDESQLHIQVVLARGVGAVVHTHSVWSTILSLHCAQESGLALEGYEMLKALQAVQTHVHREWVPILENDQDIGKLATGVRETLQTHPEAHGYLLRGHGLYTWGVDLAQAKRHAECLEFLIEVEGRRRSLRP